MKSWPSPPDASSAPGIMSSSAGLDSASGVGLGLVFGGAKEMLNSKEDEEEEREQVRRGSVRNEEVRARNGLEK